MLIVGEPSGPARTRPASSGRSRDPPRHARRPFIVPGSRSTDKVARPHEPGGRPVTLVGVRRFRRACGPNLESLRSGTVPRPHRLPLGSIRHAVSRLASFGETGRATSRVSKPDSGLRPSVAAKRTRQPHHRAGRRACPADHPREAGSAPPGATGTGCRLAVGSPAAASPGLSGSTGASSMRAWVLTIVGRPWRRNLGRLVRVVPSRSPRRRDENATLESRMSLARLDRGPAVDGGTGSRAGPNMAPSRRLVTMPGPRART